MASHISDQRGPSYTFLGVVASVSLLLDAVTKYWAETTLLPRRFGDPTVIVVQDSLAFALAYNRGGAFGLLAGENEAWRRPFFVVMSIGAVLFIVSVFRKLDAQQRALRWGLPLVLGGALGNLADRLTKAKVVDFIDYQAPWVGWMNAGIAKLNDSWYVTDHWPTFNVADVSICCGVGLMAIDAVTSAKRQRLRELSSAAAQQTEVS